MMTKSNNPPQSKPKNTTYERALSAFFDGQQPTADQQKNLPQDIDGLSIRRQAMIQAVWDAKHESEQLQALKILRARFGLPHDIRIIVLALNVEDEPMSLDALKALEQWLEAQLTTDNQELISSWRAKLASRIDRLMIRSFREDIHTAAQRCSHLMRTP